MTGTTKYHCLIAGLPELDLADRKAWITSGDFRQQLEQELHPDDFDMVKLLLMRLDNDQLAEFIEKGEFSKQPASNYSLEDLRYQVEQFDAILPEEDILPPYMVRVLKDYHQAEGEIDRTEIERVLADAYYQYILEHGNDFLKAFTEFEYNMSNLLAYVEAGNHATDPWKFIAGDTVFIKNLREDGSVTMAASAGFEMFNEITCYAELPFLSEKEMRYDEVRWRMIGEMVFFDEFTVSTVLGYLLRILLLERWSLLEKKAGEEKLRAMVDRARESSRNKMKEIVQ